MSAWGRQLWNLNAPAASDVASLHGFGLDLRRWFEPLSRKTVGLWAPTGRLV